MTVGRRWTEPTCRDRPSIGSSRSAGALALLALVLFGAVGVAVLTIAIGSVLALVAAGVGPRRDEPTPPGPESRDRWRAWRVHEPDPEYLRGRAA